MRPFFKLIFTSFFGLFILFGLSTGVHAATHISGDITESNTWTLDQSPYVIEDDMNVRQGVNLTIEPGVVVKLAPDIKIVVSGVLDALGTTDQKIYFTSFADDTVGGDSNDDGSNSAPDLTSFSNLWGSISLQDLRGFDSASIHFENTVVRYAYQGLEASNVSGFIISNSLFENNDIGFDGGGKVDASITHSTFTKNNIGININQETEKQKPFHLYTNALSVYGNYKYGIEQEFFTTPPLVFEGKHPFNWLVNILKPQTAFAGDFILDFKGVWWGDVSGPNHPILNPEGKGDKVSDNINFTPWAPNDLFLDTDCIVDCFSNVLFLPGFEGSRLYKTRNDGSEDKLWEPNANSDVEDLYLDSSGQSINPNIYTKDIIDEGHKTVNIYKSFEEKMDSLKSTQKINDWVPFAYDWRQSPDDVVVTPQKYDGMGIQKKLLTDVLQTLVDGSKNKKVTIVAHSNGGLVAKALMQKLQADKLAGENDLIDHIDVLMLIAVPEIGTAKAVPAVLHGYDQNMGFGLLLDGKHARELGRNMPGAYGLLPSKEYINRVSASPVTFKDTVVPSGATTKLMQKFGSALDSYAEYKSFLLGEEGRINPDTAEVNLPISLSSGLLAKAENLHNSIDAWTPPQSMKVIEVAGWGIPTVASYEYSPICLNNSGVNCVVTMEEQPRFTDDGDKTVLLPSAHYLSFVDNSIKKYWINFQNYNNVNHLNRDHKNILEVDSLNDLIVSTLESRNTVIDNILNDTQPAETSNRLRVSIHSPVTLDAYDENGNHTGKSCSSPEDFCYVDENIPNSSYLEFGEGKYLNIPEDKAKSIKMLGTDIGTFTYKSEKVLPDGTSTTTTFADIPVTPQTIAEVAPNFTNPQLTIDVDGDGVTDFVVQPQSDFNPVLYLQIMKRTIDGLDISQAKKDSLDRKVDRVIVLINKNKIDKVKTKVQNAAQSLIKKIANPLPKRLKPGKLSRADAQGLLDMLNELLDNLK